MNIVYGVNSNGEYIGLVDSSQAFATVLAPPPSQDWILDFGTNNWIRKVSLDAIKAQAAIDIDNQAGLTRAKYITDVPGQAATYLLKADQATKFKIANYQGAVPGLVQSEATARGISAQAAADAIIAEQDQWVALATGVETIRRLGKENVKKATSPQAVETIRLQVINQLKAI
jgi:acetyl-CoA acetyltransferase